MKSFIGRKRVLGSLLVLSAMGFAINSQAASGSGTGTLTIQESLAVEQTTPLNFGTVNKPSANENDYTFTLSTDGNLTDDGTTTDGYHSGGHSPGVWSITGQMNQLVNLSVSMSDPADLHVTIVEPYINGDTSTSTVTLDDNGSGSAQVGGEVTIGPDAAVDTHETTVTVTATYD